MSGKRTRPPSFKLEIPADIPKKTLLLDKLQIVRENLMKRMNRPVNNFDIIENVLDFWIEEKETGKTRTDIPQIPAAYLRATKGQVNQKIFMTTQTSVTRLVDIAANHARRCQGKLLVKTSNRKGHVGVLKLKCSHKSRAHHTYLWSSLPYLPTGQYLINDKINHSFVCSGMLPSHYTRFCNAAGIGILSVEKRNQFFSSYKDFVKQQYEESINDAVLEEVASYEDLDGIDIVTDARHGWRKNSKDTSVVVIGDKTHKVLNCVHISKADGPITQCHEKIGTQRIYDYFESQDISIKTHTHDRNMAINKLVKDHPFTQNQNDTWHGVKSMKESLSSIASGPRYKEGKTWSEQLKDKVEPTATHFHWAIRNCNGDTNTLMKLLDNVVEHYCKIHKDCPTSSRCRTDPNYEPSRVVITDSVAVKLLCGVIHNSTVNVNLFELCLFSI